MILAAAVLLAGCAAEPPKPSPPATVVVDTSCQHFRLITASAKDTTTTRTEIVAHNTEYLRLCPPAK
jgi:uncharacterized protein YcfL